MPSIIIGKNKISTKYQKIVAEDYLKLQQKIIERIKSVNGSVNESQRVIPSIQGK